MATSVDLFCLFIWTLFLALQSFLAVRMMIMMSASHPVTVPAINQLVLSSAIIKIKARTTFCAGISTVWSK